jgi:hypothetical protein
MERVVADVEPLEGFVDKPAYSRGTGVKGLREAIP